MSESNPVLQAAAEFNADILREKRTGKVLQEVANERARQHAKWGEQNLPFWTPKVIDVYLADSAKKSCDNAFANGEGTWRCILQEEYREALAESDPLLVRAELIQLAAVAVQIVEAIDRGGR